MPDSGKDCRIAGVGGIRLWGRYSGVGLIIAAVALAADQAHKNWMIAVYGAEEGYRFSVTSFFDVIMTWNHGISYGLLQQHSVLGRLVLIGLTGIAVSALFLWMSNAASRRVAISLGLIIGGAIGNLADRMIYGTVADFFSFHYAGFHWYVFNIADVAINAGVISEQPL